MPLSFEARIVSAPDTAMRVDYRPSVLIQPSKRPVVPEGAHGLGLIIRPALDEWQQSHPGEFACAAHIGEPEGDPSPEVIGALDAALSNPSMFDYDNPQGSAELRDAFATHLNRRKIYSYDVSSSDIIVTPGSKEAGHMSVYALLNQGDIAAASELIYPGHAAAVIMNGGSLVPFRVNPDRDYSLDPEQIDNTLNQYTPNLIYICNPGNPDGRFYTPDLAEPIVEYMIQHPEAVLLQDIIYKDLRFEEGMVMFSQIEDIADRVVTNDGASKGPRATGLRIGFIVVPRGQDELRQNLIAQANARFGCTPPLISHGLTRAFYPEGDYDIEKFRRSLVQKRDVVHEGLNTIPGLKANNPQGAFYTLINVEETGMTAEQFFPFTLNHGVGVLPASAFGSSVLGIDGQPFLRPEVADKTVRWSFGGPLEPQIQGMARLNEALTKRN